MIGSRDCEKGESKSENETYNAVGRFFLSARDGNFVDMTSPDVRIP